MRKTAYFNVEGYKNTVRVNSENVCFWHENKDGVILEMSNGETLKVKESIEVVDEKLI